MNRKHIINAHWLFYIKMCKELAVVFQVRYTIAKKKGKKGNLFSRYTFKMLIGPAQTSVATPIHGYGVMEYYYVLIKYNC